MNWQRQTKEPLFKDILWSKPENKRHAGKLVIIGGHAQSFNAVSQAYTAANRAGIGNARVIVPDKLRHMLSKLFPEAEFAPSTNIGSFSRQALGAFMDSSEWADGVLLAGDFGRNAETAVLLESFIEKYSGPLSLTGDALNYFSDSLSRSKLSDRSKTLIVGTVPQIQKIAEPMLIQQNVDFIKIIKQISDWVEETKLSVLTSHSNQLITAVDERLSSTPVKNGGLEPAVAPYATVWWLQQSDKPFEAITTAVYEISQLGISD